MRADIGEAAVKAAQAVGYWNAGTDGDSVFVKGTTKQISDRYMSNLMEHDRLIVEVKDYRGTKHTAVFNITGSSELKAVSTACGV